VGANPPPLPWRRRLEARVAAGISILVALSLGAVLIATTRAINARSIERAAREVEAARAAFDRLAADRADFAAAQAALVTALPVFRAHMTDPRLASDLATLDAMGHTYRQQLKADFLVVTDHEGRWTARPGWPDGIPVSGAVNDSIARSLAGASSRDVVVADGRLFQIVSEPAKFSDEVLGTLTAGFAIDDTVAERLARIAPDEEVNFVVDGRLHASSLAKAERTALQTLLRDDEIPASTSERPRLIGGGEFIVGGFPLSGTHGGSARLVLLHNWAPTRQFVRDVQAGLIAAGLVIFVLAVGAGVLFSRRMSRPLQDLAEAAGDIAAGNWTRRVPVHGSSEAMVMARAFNEMTTSLRHWYEQVRTRDDQLRQAQKMEAIGRLAGGVAHDFNNILTAIKGYGGLFLETLDETDPRRGDAMEVLKAADRAAVLTRQLLAFGRRQLVTPRVIGLDAVVVGLQQMLQRIIGEDIALATVIPAGLWRVRADAGQMEQVIMNLAVNARDAMPRGGTLTIELANVDLPVKVDDDSSRRPLDQSVRLSVADTGCGMDPETVSRIFEPFFTTKEEGRGTGLGLATVYGIIEQAGGTIDVDTAPGRGTTFHVFLPRSLDPEAAEAVLEPAPAPAPAARTPTETVLLVEDDEDVRALIARGIGKAGYVVLEASGAQEALALLRAHPEHIHLVLTDIVMPGLSGRELSERIMRDRPGVRVLFMSGHSDDAILRQGIQTASVPFIQKPFSIEVLASKIRDTLQAPVTAR
jgi:signal transduction histidine kinase/ActR/RegA family two-component response regulator